MKIAATTAAVMALAGTLASGARGDTGIYPLPNFRYLNEVGANAIEYGQETGEWIEISNPHGYPMDISELGLYDNNTTDAKLEDYPYDPLVPGMVIPPRGYAIVMDMKEEGVYLEGETYEEVLDQIFDAGMEDRVILLCPVDDAIGDGLHDVNDQLGVIGTAYLERPDGTVPEIVQSKVQWSGTRIPERHSWQFVNGWYLASWTPGQRNALDDKTEVALPSVKMSAK